MNVDNGFNPMEKFNQPYHFKCVHCGKCCSDPNTIVNLTYSDILRIHWDLNYDLDQLMDLIGFYVFEKEISSQERKQMVIPPIKTERGLAFLGLRKTKEGKCIFLDDNNKCSIYSARPDICRTFPFHFQGTPEEKPEKRMDISLSLTEKAKEYCEGFDIHHPIIDPDYWMELGKNAITDILQENILVKKWNKAVEEEKIRPIAKNYIRIILNQIHPSNKNKEQKNSKKSESKSYKEIVMKKLEKQN